MKNILIFSLLTLSFSLLAQPLFDCSREIPAMYLNQAEKRAQQLQALPDALKISWDSQKHIYAELIPRRMQEIPEFAKAEFVVNLRTTAPCPVRIFNLRLIDATGETFQWNKKVEWPAAGLHTVRNSVTPENADLHWGGNNDNRLDFPIRFSGFSFDFIKGSGPGELLLNSAEFFPTDGKALRVQALHRQTLADFAHTVPALQLNQPEKRFQSAKRENDALKMSWDSAKHPYIEWSFTPPLPLPKFTSGKVTATVRFPPNSSVEKFSIRLVDASGEVFQWRKAIQAIPPGTHKIEFDITPQNSSFSWGGNHDRKLDFPLRFLGLSVDYTPDSGLGELEINSLDAEWQTEQPIVDVIEAHLETGMTANVLPWGREAALQYRLTNTVNAPIAVEALLILRNFRQEEFRTHHTLKFKPNETLTLPLPVPPELGIWYATVRFWAHNDETNPRDLTQSFAYMIPAGPTPGKSEGFIFGICSHPNWSSDPEIYRKEAVAMALCGAKVMRMDLEWWQIEPARGKVDLRRYDAIIDTFAQQGIELEAILGKTPKWASTQGNLPDYNAWRNHVNMLFRHYKGRIRFWEVWNEPDLVGFATFNVPEYLQLMKIAREEQRANIPDSTLLTGGFATMSAHGSKKENFHERAVTEGKAFYDVHAYHEHGTFPHFRRQVDDLFLPMRQRRQISAPWYANETALTSAGNDELFQAQTLFKKFIFSWSRGSIGYNWYNLRNKGFDPKNGEHNYGLLTRDFQPKAAYVVYNTLATFLKGKTYVRQLPAGEGIWLFEFRDDREIILAAWNENFSRGADERFLLKSDSTQVETIDLMSNRKPAEQIGDLHLFTAGRTPGLLRLPGATQLVKMQPPLTVSPVPLFLPGQNALLDLTFHNPFKQKIDLSYSLELPHEVYAEPLDGKIFLSPGENARRTVSLKVGRNFTLPFGKTGLLKVKYKLDNSRFSDTLHLPVHTATLLPTGFTLNRREQVVSLFDADPTRTHMLWRDPADLSGTVTLDIRNGKLVLDATINDDRHVQPYTGSEVWQGDNLQLALSIPGQQGMWELGLTCRDNGSSEAFCWSAPRGYRETETARQISLQTKRDKVTTRYQAEIPLTALGITPELAHSGFRFNLLANDNDGQGRKGWIQIAPGIGMNKSPDHFPFVLQIPQQ